MHHIRHLLIAVKQKLVIKREKTKAKYLRAVFHKPLDRIVEIRVQSLNNPKSGIRMEHAPPRTLDDDYRTSRAHHGLCDVNASTFIQRQSDNLEILF
jgi:hypothetical protein